MILWIGPSACDKIVIDRGALTVIPWKRDEPYRKIGGRFIGSHPDPDLRPTRNVNRLSERIRQKKKPVRAFFSLCESSTGLLHIIDQGFISLASRFLTPQSTIGP